MRKQALYCLLPLLLVCACSSEKQPIAVNANSSSYFPISIAGHTLELQLALTDSERSKGLMFREKLDEDSGMLFLFEASGRRSFWMRNTGISLDLAYFDTGGKLLEIHSLYPYNENLVQSQSADVLIAVETNQGWFARNGIEPGAKLDLKELKEAVIQRGYSISKYSIETTL